MPLNPADDAFVAQLTASLPRGRVRLAEPRDLEEPRGKWRGQAAAVVSPVNVAEVSSVIRLCRSARVGVVPVSGGTGLVSGQVMPEGPMPVLLSLQGMSRIRGLWPSENVLVAEAGAILADVQEAARDAGRLFPLSLASEGSARIGGLLSTNAGGVNVLRYGNARDQVLGIEAVLPDGQIWHGLRRLRKDNTGYDLRHLLMGAEGTLGIITAAALRLSPVPAAVGTAFLQVASPGAALALLGLARDDLGAQVSSFELIDGAGLRFLDEVLPDVRQPFARRPDWSVLIEVGVAAGIDPAAALEDLFVRAHAAGLVTDGAIAQSGAQRDAFWKVREQIPEANRLIGAVASHDIAVPLSAIPDFIARAKAALAAIGPLRVNAFGHMGDGNLHFNAFPPRGATGAEWKHLAGQVSRVVHDLTDEFEGSFSAEHGVGRAKVDELERYGDPAKLSAMRAIKAALDPAGIMNPGAVLRAAP